MLVLLIYHAIAILLHHNARSPVRAVPVIGPLHFVSTSKVKDPARIISTRATGNTGFGPVMQQLLIFFFVGLVQQLLI
jgi:hypothetical protein